MSRQLAISCAISVMAMAAFVLFGPSLSQHVGPLPQATGLHLLQLTDAKALLAF